MRLQIGNVLLLTGSLLTALCALFWPNIEQAYLARSSRHVSTTGAATGKCPLGYEGPMPSNHPPINLQHGHKSAKAAGPTTSAQSVTFANATIWTADPQAPWATNMTVNLATGDIMAMGLMDMQPSSSSSSSSSSNAAVGSSKGRIVDMQGAFIMPGIVDPHVHLIPAGLFLRKVNLRAVKGREDFAARLAAAAVADGGSGSSGDGSSGSDGDGSSGSSSSSELRVPWLIGAGWSESDWGGGLPDRTWIDEACGSQPAFLTRMDSHMALVNTAALTAAGLMQQQQQQPSTQQQQQQQQQQQSDESAAAAAAAAAAAGFDAETAAAIAAADAEGLIDRDPHTGLPTGLLRESAMTLVERLIPTPSVEDRAAALQAAGRYLSSRGVTSVGDMGWGLFGAPSLTWSDLEEVYDVAALTGNMPVRVSAYVPLRSWKRLAARVAAQGTFHPMSARLTWGGVKEFADGSLGSSTALMWQPYLDAPPTAADAAANADADAESRESGVDSSGSSSSGGGSSDGSSSSNGSSGGVAHDTGTRTIPTDEMQQLIKGAAAAGLQVAVHAIGDRAVDEVIGVFEATLAPVAAEQQQQRQPGQIPAERDSSSSSSRGMHHRIEHVQHLSSPKAAARMAALGLAGVPNPQHLLSDRPMLVSKLGLERSGPGRAFAYKTLADSGVRVGFASDWPVVDIDPWTSIYAAVYRSDPPAHTAANVAAGGGSSGSSSGSSSSGGSDGGSGDVDDDRVLSKPAKPWESAAEQLGLTEVLMSHTKHAAYVARLDHWVGQLSPGFKADFIVLDRSPFEVLKKGVEQKTEGFVQGGLQAGLPQVVQTYMDGVCVQGCHEGSIPTT